MNKNILAPLLCACLFVITNAAETEKSPTAAWLSSLITCAGYGTAAAISLRTLYNTFFGTQPPIIHPYLENGKELPEEIIAFYSNQSGKQRMLKSWNNQVKHDSNNLDEIRALIKSHFSR